jgi:hypothetical protein
MSSRRIASLAAVACFVSAPHAHAQSPQAQAEALFREARDLLAAGKIAEACAAFDSSEKLDPTIATRLNQADCRERLGQLATAWGLFLVAEREARGVATTDGQQMHESAVVHAARLEPRLSKLTIAVADEQRVDGLEIRRDGELVDIGAWGRALPIDGGHYRVTAAAPGRSAWAKEIDVAVERDDQRVEIPQLEPIQPPPAEHPPVETPPLVRATPHASRRAPLLLGGTAAGLAAIAIGFELWGERTYGRANMEPDKMIQASLWQDANHQRYAAEGFAVASLACAGVAIWWWLRHPAHVTFAPTVQRGGAALGARLTW